MACVISVASGKGGVGKSVVSVNLALVLARMGKQVVLTASTSAAPTRM